VARVYLRELLGDLRGVSYDDVASLVALRDGKEFALRKGFVLRRESGRIGLKRRRPAARPYRILWDGRGVLSVPAAGFSFSGSVREGGEAGTPARIDDAAGAVLDAGKLRLPLLVRNRRPGDLYRPLGAPGRKKLKEILRAKGVPVAARDRLPVFVSGGEIAWAPGLPVSERFKIGRGTRRVLAIRVRSRPALDGPRRIRQPSRELR
jgi:tRNA(Ile)-lysidine synthase